MYLGLKSQIFLILLIFSFSLITTVVKGPPPRPPGRSTPTSIPTSVPTAHPTLRPTARPTVRPTEAPTRYGDTYYVPFSNISYQGDVINCPSNRDCIINCDRPNVCQNSVINCPSRDNDTISISDNNYFFWCLIKCNNTDSCSGAEINAQNSSYISLTCSETDACFEININGPEINYNESKISITASAGSAKDMIIYADATYNLYISCFGVKSCSNSYIVGPISTFYAQSYRKSAFENTTLNAHSTEYIYLDCGNEDSCKYFQLSAYYANQTVIECNENSCSGTIFRLYFSNDVTLYCNDECKNTTIFTQFANSVTLECKSNGACNTTYLYAPNPISAQNIDYWNYAISEINFDDTSVPPDSRRYFSGNLYIICDGSLNCDNLGIFTEDGYGRNDSIYFSCNSDSNNCKDIYVYCTNYQIEYDDISTIPSCVTVIDNTYFYDSSGVYCVTYNDNTCGYTPIPTPAPTFGLPTPAPTKMPTMPPTTKYSTTTTTTVVITPSGDAQTLTQSKSDVGLIVGLVIGIIAAIILFAYIYYRYNKQQRKKAAAAGYSSDNDNNEIGMVNRNNGKNVNYNSMAVPEGVLDNPEAFIDDSPAGSYAISRNNQANPVHTNNNNINNNNNNKVSQATALQSNNKSNSNNKNNNNKDNNNNNILSNNTTTKMDTNGTFADDNLQMEISEKHDHDQDFATYNPFEDPDINDEMVTKTSNGNNSNNNNNNKKSSNNNNNSDKNKNLLENPFLQEPDDVAPTSNPLTNDENPFED